MPLEMQGCICRGPSVNPLCTMHGGTLAPRHTITPPLTFTFTTEQLQLLRGAIRASTESYNNSLRAWKDDAVMEHKILHRIEELNKLLKELGI